MNTENTRVILRKNDRIEYILSGVETYYGIDRIELLKKARTPERYKIKSFVVKILRDIADCSFKDIKHIYNNKSEETIWTIHQRVTEKLESKYDCDVLLRKEYNNLLKSMGL